MPHIVVIIDEYADLMMNSANVLQENVKKLGNKARAAGIHLILATQRPSAKIVEGDIKANMTTRIALKMSSSTDSTTILNCGDAARLLGKGDMLLMRQDKGDLQRVHGCYTSKDVVKKAVELLPQKKLYRINEEDVFKNDIHDLHAQEDLKKHATWGELNAVSKIILENFSEFMDREYDTIYQVCARRLGMDKSRVDIVFSDVSGAIGDSDFYQVLQRSCSENDENCDYPFVKAVIYSSPLKWKFKDGRYLFTDYILEQAFEKDDAAAMASVRFFCNVETFHLDYLKKKLNELYKNGNEKAQKFLNKLIENLFEAVEACEKDSEFFDEMVECENKNAENTNKKIFDELLAEAYPPLMNYLLKSGAQQYIERTSHSNSRIENFIVEQALVNELWQDFAMSYFFDDVPFNHDDLFIENVLKLASHDIDEAIKDLCDFPDFYDLENSFYELTEYGQEKAVNYICKQFDPSSTYSECRQEDLILECAIEGNARAVGCILDNYDFFQEELIAAFIDGRLSIENRLICHDGKNLILESVEENMNLQHHLIDEAEQEKEYAWEIISDCIDIEEFHAFVEKMLCNPLNENIESLAKQVVFANPETFSDIVLEFARNGNVSARNAIYKYIYYENDFCEYVLDDAREGNSQSQKVVYNNPQIQLFQQYILDEARLGDEDAIAVIYSHPDVDNFHNYILQQAKLSDDEAIEVIYSHPNDADFRDYILQQAKAGDYDAKNIVLENPAIALFQEYICKLVSSSDEEAKAVVLSNVKYDLFRKCIVELTLQGDHEAKKVALANVKYDIFQNCVVELALQGDCNAKKAILENYEIKLFQECVCKLALNDDVDAKKVVQINYEN
jgi:hypothetical protein